MVGGGVHPSTVGKCDIVYKWDIECRSMYGLVCLCYAYYAVHVGGC